MGYPTVTARRALEDLAAHGVVSRRSLRAVTEGKDKRNADVWELTPWAREEIERACVPDMSGEESDEGEPPLKNPHRMYDDISGTQSDEEDRLTRCWQCQAELDAAVNLPCSACDWLLCPCGACSTGCVEAGERSAS